MLTLINSNLMRPPIAPLGLEYVACAARRDGVRVEVLDLCMVDDPVKAVADYFTDHRPDLVGISFRNTDDSYWPHAQWFVPVLKRIIGQIRTLSDAPVFLGGCGFSIYPGQIMACTGADFGIHGDGETAVTQLYRQWQGARRYEDVPGLIYRQNGSLHRNPAAWPDGLSVPTGRDMIDNAAYLKAGAQVGLETKRGCPRQCIYCADPLAKGCRHRLRDPHEIADEAEALLGQGIDVLHLCDGEFNLPYHHAEAVCEEFIRRRLGDRLQWYTYMAITPYDDRLAGLMRRAGCVGVDFTGDSACRTVLERYNIPHQPDDLAAAVRHSHTHGMVCMIDLLLGGPSETPETAAESIEFLKRTDVDCIGSQLAMRVYEGTPAAEIIRAEGPLEDNPGIRRKYTGPVDFFRPTFYISPALGERPAGLICDLIDGDPRFFAPEDETHTATDHNYSDNTALTDAIAAGHRGAYWHILLKLRS